jgi:hypothetical protein
MKPTFEALKTHCPTFVTLARVLWTLVCVLCAPFIICFHFRIAIVRCAFVLLLPVLLLAVSIALGLGIYHLFV